jgi:metal-responsive CopG/Arc/MetJ family transcriptional regulator
MKTRVVRTRATRAAVQPASRKVIVEFPIGLYAETERMTNELSISRSALIRSALQEFLARRSRDKLERELAEGYTANAFQARQTANEFSNVDSELL